MVDPKLQDLLTRAAAGDEDALAEVGRQAAAPRGRAGLEEAGAAAAGALAALVAKKKGKTRAQLGEMLAAIADQVEGAQIEPAVPALLEDLKQEAAVRAGLQIAKRAKNPPASWAEPCADASSVPGAVEALKRFPFSAVQRELRSLLSSRSPAEQCAGMALLQHHGQEAAAFLPIVQESLRRTPAAESAAMAIDTLARLLPADQLADALAPALDHHSPAVQKAARDHLRRVKAPVRESAWAGHPFSTDLLIQLQRLGFQPLKLPVPAERPLPSREFKEGERIPADDAAQVGPAAWALIEESGALKWPGYVLYTVWGSYEDSYTFHFGSDSEAEGSLFPVEYSGKRRIMHVIGDGSIGYYAAIDLLDPSDDPAVYYLERWGPQHGIRRQSYTLSGYLKNLGTR